MTQEELNGLARKILDAAFRVHTTLGPGLLETAYTACLVYELRKMGLEARTEVPVPIVYDGTKLTDVGYRIDILVQNEIILEIKSVDTLAPVHFSQITSYLKLADRRLGFLLNFNVERFRDGIYRRVHQF